MSEIFSDGIGARIVENSEESLFECLKQYLGNEELRTILSVEGKTYCKIFRERVKKNINAYYELLNGKAQIDV